MMVSSPSLNFMRFSLRRTKASDSRPATPSSPDCRKQNYNLQYVGGPGLAFETWDSRPGPICDESPSFRIDTLSAPLESRYYGSSPMVLLRSPCARDNPSVASRYEAWEEISLACASDRAEARAEVCSNRRSVTREASALVFTTWSATPTRSCNCSTLS